MAYTIKAVADLACISVRALHHYHHIGLLAPASATPSGYRLYTEADLERLQQILFFRELGFSLQDIKCILDSPGFDRREALMTHRRLLMEKQNQLERMIASVDNTIESIERGANVDNDKMFEGFDVSKMEEYREEARQKWGKVVDESYERTSKFTKEDWAEIGAESNAINQAMAFLMGRDPADPDVQHWIGRWFHLIDERFYRVTPEVFRGIGEGYVADSRFTAFYDKIKPGLALFMRDAMRVYSDKLIAGG